MWVEDRISKSKNNRAAVMFCHTEIHIPLLCPVNFHEQDRNNLLVVDHCL